MVWTPHVTVAAIVEREGRFLMVEEDTDDGVMINQPAGHLEKGESLIDAVVRETQEESAWLFQPAGLVGIYRWPHPTKDITFIRFAFAGDVSQHDPAQKLDDGIIRSLWMTLDELRGCEDRHRSPQVMLCVTDFLNGKLASLDILNELK